MTATLAAPRREVRTAWIHRAGVDVAVALCWVPFAVAAHAWASHPELVTPLLAATLVLSLAHQPLTLALVYGDPAQFALRRRLFTWSPVIFLVAVVVGLHVSLVLVAAVVGLWNAEHTLMQRFGLTRIYGRKAGQADGSIERAMLLSWLVVALVWAAADPATAHRAGGLGLGATNERSVAALASLQPAARLLLVPVVLAAVVLLAVCIRAERDRPIVNPAKFLYLASTAALFGVMMIDPVAGLVAYVGSHALEYLVIVHQHLGRRYLEPDDGGGVLGAAVRARTGRTGVLLGYLALMAGVFTLLRAHLPDTASTTVLLTAGGLHVFYDGVIWKLRRPAVAKGFALQPAA